jgi:hypothetical protein
MPRCPNGYRRHKKTRECTPKVAKSPQTVKTRKRCPKGSRKNKQGDCVRNAKAAMMKEIQANDLVPGKTYYVETNLDHVSNAMSRVSTNRRRQKGIFKKFIPSEDDDLDMVHFESVENLNPNDPVGSGITGEYIYPHMREVNHPDRYTRVYIPGRMFYYTEYTRFYEYKKEEIIKRKEREATNNFLQRITGDPKFNFY